MKITRDHLLVGSTWINIRNALRTRLFRHANDNELTGTELRKSTNHKI